MLFQDGKVNVALIGMGDPLPALDAVNIKDVAHMYLGCDIKIHYENQPPREGILTPAFLGDLSGVELVLRPMSSMTRKEILEYHSIWRTPKNLEEEVLNNSKMILWLTRNRFDVFGINKTEK